ncbi:TetR/AcrR family transcriptional regulator [Undibacterium rugosum]|uniref:TetR/AcrR family transcriptional regulator n=1 Tax=Undibacterium rugosum TaxID=2762291 RepID=A0A923KZU2_9BURK|nr:TetR/AcrR family transcriptional regulator [Undibacterium rugosum]MBC3935676.1 TetR/AcrR family transcriptional regulator [Undibacterium rugosum]MBR7778561.1 TetR/AcrR family transcriptional regulator [Undibacterium rugosum]
MTTSASKLNSNDTRERILATGEQLILGKGFSALGLSEILSAAAVPKGSFYHYFASKEAFGVALIERYFQEYHQQLRTVFSDQRHTPANRLLQYFEFWLSSTQHSQCHKLCLAVKLAAEVSDLSQTMRLALAQGMQTVIELIAAVLDEAKQQGELRSDQDVQHLATTLYGQWVGASLLTKVYLQTAPLEAAWIQTQQLLQAESSQ